jgi:tyrosyl-tRNA synthetase
MKCIRMLTFLPLEQIDEMDKWTGSDLNRAKEILAFELTAMVHGEAEAKKAEASAKALFGGGGDAENMPVTALTDADFTDGVVDILTLLVKTGLCSSRGDARRNVEQGGVTAGDEKVTDIGKTFGKEAFRDGLILRRGKKNYKKLIVE